MDAETPIIVSVHVPFLSVYYPALEGEYRSNDTFSNFRGYLIVECEGDEFTWEYVDYGWEVE